MAHLQQQVVYHSLPPNYHPNNIHTNTVCWPIQIGPTTTTATIQKIPQQTIFKKDTITDVKNLTTVAQKQQLRCDNIKVKKDRIVEKIFGKTGVTYRTLYSLTDSVTTALKELDRLIQLNQHNSCDFVEMWILVPAMQDVYDVPFSEKLLSQLRQIKVPKSILSPDCLILSKFVVCVRFMYDQEVHISQNIFAKMQCLWYPCIEGKVSCTDILLPNNRQFINRMRDDPQIIQCFENFLVKLKGKAILFNSNYDLNLREIVVKSHCGGQSTADYTYTQTTQEILLAKKSPHKNLQLHSNVVSSDSNVCTQQPVPESGILNQQLPNILNTPTSCDMDTIQQQFIETNYSPAKQVEKQTLVDRFYKCLLQPDKNQKDPRDTVSPIVDPNGSITNIPQIMQLYVFDVIKRFRGIVSYLIEEGIELYRNEDNKIDSFQKLQENNREEKQQQPNKLPTTASTSEIFCKFTSQYCIEYQKKYGSLPENMSQKQQVLVEQLKDIINEWKSVCRFVDEIDDLYVQQRKRHKLSINGNCQNESIDNHGQNYLTGWQSTNYCLQNYSSNYCARMFNLITSTCILNE